MREIKPLLAIDDLKQSRLVTVYVTTHDGKEVPVTISMLEQTGDVKERVLGESAAKDLPNYKVIHLSSRRILEDQRTIEQEGVNDGDHLLLYPKRRNITSPFRKSTFSSKGPDATVIKDCTSFLGEERGNSMTSSSFGPPGVLDFFCELKRILTSLTEVASLIQHVNSEEGTENENEGEEQEVMIDPLCLKRLTDMGFSDARGRKALVLNRMNPVQAMEWLLLHESDPNIDTPLTPEEIDSYIPLRKRRRKKNNDKKKEFVPNARAVMNLQEMGFPEKDVLEALRATGNQQERALDWLLGDKQPMEGATEDGGLDTNSPQYVAIMENPVVQLGLTNPRILHAFEDMLENPNNSGQYINDPEIGPVLLQISRIVQSFSR